MLMVDTGFVGADMILTTTSTARLGLANMSTDTSESVSKNLIGIGRTPVDMVRCVVSKITICGHDLHHVDALCSTSSASPQTPSAYADGYLGMGLLCRFDLWLDVLHERIALDMAT